VSADLYGADLAGAKLSAADLANANLGHVKSGRITGNPTSLPTDWILVAGYLIGPSANLSGADLAGAEISDADLVDAHLTGADLSALKSPWVRAPSPPPEKWLFRYRRGGSRPVPRHVTTIESRTLKLGFRA
jgi:hypothetical protein